MNNVEPSILRELDNLRDRQDKHEETTEKILDKLTAIEVSLARFKEHQKWELRIASCVWAGIMLGLSWVLGLHGK